MLVIAYAGAGETAPNLHELMKNVAATQSQIIWDAVNKAQDDDGNADPSKFTSSDWSRIVGAGNKVKQAAVELAKAAHVMAAAPGQKLQDEANPGAFNAKAVQKTIDSNPKVFAAFAQNLALVMDQITAAAKLQDGLKLNEVSGRLDQVCEQCHLQFWYPEQKAR
jgi:hypothetical protein